MSGLPASPPQTSDSPSFCGWHGSRIEGAGPRRRDSLSKAWDTNATVIWSDETQLIGQRFADNDELQAALRGKVEVEIKRLTKSENDYERAAFATLAEVYVPILSTKTGEVLGVVEVYKTPSRLLETIRKGQVVIWAISLTGGLALYAVLLPLFTQVYRRKVEEETLRAYAGCLEEEVAQRTTELRLQSERLLQAQKMKRSGVWPGASPTISTTCSRSSWAARNSRWCEARRRGRSARSWS